MNPGLQMPYEGSGSPNGPVLRLRDQIARRYGYHSKYDCVAPRAAVGGLPGIVDAVTAQ